MAWQSVPDTIGAFVRGTYQGIPWENTFYCNYIAVPDVGDLQTLADAILSWVNTEWCPVMSTSCEINEVNCRDLAAEIALQAEANNTPPEPGTVSGGTLPTYTAIAVARRSGLTGRSSRGRIFWTGMTEGQVTGNILDSGLVTAVLNAVSGIDTVMAALGYAPCIVSRYAGGVKRPVAVTFEIQSWLINNTLIDTRRSRKQAE